MVGWDLLGGDRLVAHARARALEAEQPVAPPFGREPSGASEPHRPTSPLINRAATVLTAVAFVGLHSLGVLGRQNIFILVAVLGVAVGLTELVLRLAGPTCAHPRPHAVMGVRAIAITAVIYGIGWGPALTIGYLFLASEALEQWGPDARWPVLAWAALGLTLGDIGVELGWVSSYLRTPLIHAMAALSFLGLSFVVYILSANLEATEDAQHALRRQEERSRVLVQNASDVITVLDTDGTVRYSSAAAERLLGYPPGDAIGTSAFALVHPDDVERVQAEYNRQLQHAGVGEPVRFRMLHANGEWKHVEAVANNLADDPQIRGVVVVTRDRSQQVEYEAALHEAQQRFRTAFDRAPIGMSLVDMDRRILDVNHALCQMLGYSKDELISRSTRDIMHPHDWPADAMVADRMLSGELPEFQTEKRFLHAEGRTVWVMVNRSLVRDEHGHPLYWVNQIQDITERRRDRERLAHMAMHDTLTELPNRAMLLERLRVAMHRAETARSRVGVVYLDIDRFKVVNDSLGHEAGDRVLQVVAHRLQSLLGRSHMVFRLGGDEFVVLCEDIAHEEEALNVASRVGSAIATPCRIGESTITVTASIGVAVSNRDDASDAPRERVSPEDLLRDADVAMYRAKSRGKNRAELFDDQMRAQVIERLETETHLRYALSHGGLVLHYQPEVRLVDGRIVGMEALVRWQHPEHGLIGPDQFIELAEETGLIVPIGTWVMHEACEQAVRWRREGHFDDSMFVSVNLSSRQLIDHDLLGTVKDVLADTGLPPAALELEMTESGLMEDADQSAEVLRAIRAIGVGFAVDDFGTGYSSLSYLKRLPVDTVKIDRTFVDGLGHDPEDEAIVRAVVAMTRALGQRPIAEGISSAEQSRVLQSLGCGLGQGWLFGHAQPPERVEWPSPANGVTIPGKVIRLVGDAVPADGGVVEAPSAP